MAKTTTLLPRGFDPSNPEAQKNIAASNKAADDLQDIIRQKAEFLKELVEDHFGGVDTLAAYLRSYLDRADPANADSISKEVEERWNQLDREHTEAGNRLVRSIAGR